MLNRDRIKFKSLSLRKNKVHISTDAVHPDPHIAPPEALEAPLKEITGEVLSSRSQGRPVILAFGAHTIKNGLSPVLIEMMRRKWLTHLATNGAGVIHDWEIAYQGKTSEDVAENVKKGEFGIWQETGFYINLALAAGAFEGRGYGESVGALISRGGLDIPSQEKLNEHFKRYGNTFPGRAAAALDFETLIRKFSLKPGFLKVHHPCSNYSVQAAAFNLKIPFTSHPMFGHDIIYTHPASCGAALGRTAETDFLRYAESVSRLEGGVLISLGSAVMSPMIFEKSLSMARNIAGQDGRSIENFRIFVVDLAESSWNWEKGEPPADNPAYYLRYCKTFSRMGGKMSYIRADNKSFLPGLCRQLSLSAPPN